MAKRYDQYCPVAHALELVGERWSLLIVRELLKGPKRYTDLAGALPGIGTNVLAADTVGFYHLFVERRWDGVSVEGDHALLERMLDAAAPVDVAVSGAAA